MRKGHGKENTGKDFEKLLTAVFEGYRKRGIADIEKVDPPVRIVRKPVPRVIFLENPWLDYSGSWTEMGGRMLVIEAKSTEKPLLELGEGGLTSNQQKNLMRWHANKAAVGVVWYHKGAVKVITAATLASALNMDVKSFRWEHLPATPKGEGWIIWDVLDVIASRS